MNAPEPVRSKHVYSQLWQQGAFGNRLRVWLSLKALRASTYQGPLSIRYLGEEGGRWTFYNVANDNAEQMCQRIITEGGEAARIIFNENAPDERLVLQGELWTGADRLYWLIYSRLKAKMREALRTRPLFSFGLSTLMLLRGAMTPSSYADMETLVEMYPAHAIEFSVYSMCCGNIPGRNTVIWEVRRY